MAILQPAMARLVGRRLARVAAGGAAGSIIGLHFDEPGRAPPTDPSAGWYLGVECSWRLEADGNLLTSWADSNAPEGPMVQGLNRLVGCPVTRVTVTGPAYDAVLDFSPGLRLTVFCDLVRERICWYLAGPDDTDLSVHPAGVVLLG